ncbi:MAG: superoxide dismutase family protein [Planctomycetota bacterium]
MLNHLLTTAALAAPLALIPACGDAPPNPGETDYGHHHHHHAQAFAEVEAAICVLRPTGHAELPSVAGTVRFTETDHGLRVQANVSGLKPNHKHGFQVHQLGDISAPDGTATAGHFNPGDQSHRHHGHTHADHDHHIHGDYVGDLGHLESDADGNATYDKVYGGISLVRPGTGILGRSVVIHFNEYDAEPATDNASPRVAQGVIGIDE